MSHIRIKVADVVRAVCIYQVALSMSCIVEELASVLHSVDLREYAVALHPVIVEIALVHRTIGELEFSSSMSTAFAVLTFITGPIRPFVVTMSILLVVLPVSLVLHPI